MSAGLSFFFFVHFAKEGNPNAALGFACACFAWLCASFLAGRTDKPRIRHLGEIGKAVYDESSEKWPEPKDKP